MNLWPVLIPSKGRPNCPTAKLINGWIVVEPQDRKAYAELWGEERILPLAKDNQGIAYVRNQCLEFGRNSDVSWFWMLDDDIQGAYETVLKRLSPRPLDVALLGAQRIIEGVPLVGQAALEYAQFAWSQTKPFTLNGYCDVAVAINVKATRSLSYRAEFNLKEDRDFTLQILKSGWKTLRTSQISFKAPKNGSNAGGLQEEYLAGKERIAVDKMVQEWGPQICTSQTKPNGRYDLKINWRFFK